VTTEGDSTGREVGRLGEATAAQGKRKWRYELDSGTKEDDVPMLVQKVGWTRLGCTEECLAELVNRILIAQLCLGEITLVGHHRCETSRHRRHIPVSSDLWPISLLCIFSPNRLRLMTRLKT
jgi:hypothetical protein